MIDEAAIAAISEHVIRCGRCPELRAYCAQLATEKKRAYRDEEYWGKPVPALGDADARVMLVGLAPGAHGSNRTGRMFTGDASGDFLYPALYRAGFANQPAALDRSDGLRLNDCFITAAARCAPPGNKPTPQELRNCFPYLLEEFAALGRLRVVIGLGSIGMNAALKMLAASGYAFEKRPFGHGIQVDAHKDERIVTAIASYHPSRQNTNTGVLTTAMFDGIFTQARNLLDV
ncbi:MAG: uracil-DNA glycosylase [Candidatus Eremiobacteraeota bacterium]|nr:uracil-DNA glycosylase [Candidatus Eremiobacteraeota bacterium]